MLFLSTLHSFWKLICRDFFRGIINLINWNGQNIFQCNRYVGYCFRFVLYSRLVFNSVSNTNIDLVNYWISEELKIQYKKEKWLQFIVFPNSRRNTKTIIHFLTPFHEWSFRKSEIISRYLKQYYYLTISKGVIYIVLL